MAQGRAHRVAGDMTGREKARLSAEAAEEQTRRAAEMSMLADAQQQEVEHGIHDPQSQAVVDSTVPEAVEIDDEPGGAVMVERRPPPSFGNTPPGGPSEQVFTGQEPPEVVERMLAEFERPVASGGPERLQQSTVVIRTPEDVDDMTYGMRNGEPNNYTFKAGVAYRVPREIAEHLRERDLIQSYH